MKQNRVVARIKGGLGNQLFCYAAARRMALVNDAELIIDDVSGFTYDDKYRRRYQLDHFNIDSRKLATGERLTRVGRYLRRAYNARLPFCQRSYIQQESADFDPRLLQIKPRGTVYIEGYWQSEYYFKDVASTIREDLRITAPTDSLNLSIAQHIRGSSAIAVHVRFFDEPNVLGANNAPSNYYARAIERMESLVPDAHYFLFSDQPDAARTLIRLPNDRVTTVSHNKGDDNAYADLWLMAQCRHFIIANSTFSWWGAWLSNYSHKQVIAPGFKIQGKERVTSWGFSGLLPDEWIKV